MLPSLGALTAPSFSLLLHQRTPARGLAGGGWPQARSTCRARNHLHNLSCGSPHHLHHFATAQVSIKLKGLDPSALHPQAALRVAELLQRCAPGQAGFSQAFCWMSTSRRRRDVAPKKAVTQPTPTAVVSNDLMTPPLCAGPEAGWWG